MERRARIKFPVPMIRAVPSGLVSKDYVRLFMQICNFEKYCVFLPKNRKKDMVSLYTNETYKKIHFAVMAIEASARKANISGRDMHDRLLHQGLIHKRLFRYYEQLHTQSLNWVVDDTIETLLNWEKEEREIQS